MAQLRFTIKHQHIYRNDTFRPVAKSQNYLYAGFFFETEEWTDKTVTVLFKAGDTVYEVVLDELHECLVPWEVLAEPGVIKVSCFAGDLITVDESRVTVYQTGYTEDAESGRGPSPSVYTQIIERLDALRTDMAALSDTVAQTSTEVSALTDTVGQMSDTLTQVSADVEALEPLNTVINGGTFKDWRE